jgi:hypothetical protein
LRIPGDASQPGSTLDDEKAQSFRAQDAIAKGSLPGRRFGVAGSGAVESCASVMSQQAKLQPCAVGAVLIGGNCVEGKLALEFANDLFPPCREGVP